MSSQQYPQSSSQQLPSPQPRQQPYQQYPNHGEQQSSERQHLTGQQPPRANSDSSSSLYSLSAYSTDIQNQPVHSPSSQSSYMASGKGAEYPQGLGQKEINLDDYLEELRIANASPENGTGVMQRDLTGLGITDDTGSRNGSPFGE
ncbi:hypothetical protein QFC19_004162 [Naganishia cerealis]|uniref:Uncharacterized protein n=1 Tax=Naganishia cerealis TaxID=610337 RepID=A0ACC2VY81_9TREE|nr:hypothetical protein QFC19_004162 [Naganishia cerealis]